MIQTLKKRLLTLVALLALMAPAGLPVTVYAEDSGTTVTVPSAEGNLTDSFCTGTDVSIDNESGACEGNAEQKDNVNNAVKLGLNLFSAIVGIISVVMIIVGGIRYITSGGDSGKVTSAQNTVMYAVIGLVVVALAQIIVKFVLGRFTGA